MKRRPLVVLGIVLGGALAVAYFSGLGEQERQVRALRRLGATEVPSLPIYREWVDSLGACLGDGTRFDERARYLISNAVPRSWVDAHDTALNKGAYTNVQAHLVVFAEGRLTKALFTHEAWHLAHGEGHPARVFNPPLCGMAAP